MLDQTTIAQLRALRLQGFADAFQQQLAQPELHAMSFEERLALLVDREVNNRADRKRARLLNDAQLKFPEATIENADFADISGLDRKTLTSLALSGWVERGDTILFCGATGLGKTWLACALAQYACRHGHSALFLRMPRLAEELRVLHGSGSFGKWLLQLAKRAGPGNLNSRISGNSAPCDGLRARESGVEHEEKSEAQPHADVQGQGRAGGGAGRQDPGGVGQAV